MNEMEIGVIKHFFDKIGVAAIEITDGALAVGETIHITGHTSDCTTTVESMQIEHDNVDSVTKGDMVGIRVPDKVRVHDKVYKIVE